MGNKLHVQRLVLAIAAASAAVAFQADKNPEVARWRQEAARVTIIRDDWGIAHVYGKTGRDAVFGMEYTQAEETSSRRDQLPQRHGAPGRGRRRVEDLPGPAHEALIDPAELKKDYAASPAWRAAHGRVCRWPEYYLYKHPEVKPRSSAGSSRGMALSFTEGSIGGDIETVNLNQLAAFYGKAVASRRPAAGSAIPSRLAPTAPPSRPPTRLPITRCC